jgi:hypothetical protein
MQKPATQRLLSAANWVLLGVSWGMSLYAYPRLQGEMASWPSVWQFNQAMVEKSMAFFLNPVLQTVFFFGFLALIQKLSIRAAISPGRAEPPGDQRAGRLRGLRNEVACLALIFFNLVFIHLQTSRILVSHRLAAGINRTYFIMLFLVLIILVPYYRLRRQIVLRD